MHLVDFFMSTQTINFFDVSSNPHRFNTPPDGVKVGYNQPETSDEHVAHGPPAQRS